MCLIDNNNYNNNNNDDGGHYRHQQNETIEFTSDLANELVNETYQT